MGTAARSRATQNCFSDNNEPGSASGNGVYSDQGLRTATIRFNDFELHGNAGILFTDAAAPVMDIAVSNNASTDDLTFLNIFGGDGYFVRANSVRDTSAGFGDQGSAIRIGGGTTQGTGGATAVTLLRNSIISDHFAGIAVREDANDVVARENTIIGTTRGVDVSAGIPGAIRIKQNIIRNVSQFGILLESNTSENQINGNDVRNSDNKDCLDRSMGSNTGGTANTWVGNEGNKASPPEICD